MATEDAHQKMVQHLELAEAALAENDNAEAENQVTRASMLQTQVQDPNVIIRYKALYAIVLDKHNRFAEAALRYYELSVKPGLTHTEKTEALQNTVICTVLASPGMHRTRLLKVLAKDDRCPNLVGFNIIKSMFMEKLIGQDQLHEFESILKENQREVDRDGSTILQKAVLQHNLLAVSRLFKNITFDDVSELLGIAPELVEKLVTKLISIDSLHGHVDQIERLITFDDPQRKPPTDWSSYVISVCEETNKVSDLIAEHYPEWHASRAKSDV